MKEIKIALEDLSSIVSHYRALPILIAFVKAHGGEACLQKWDKERNKKLIILYNLQSRSIVDMYIGTVLYGYCEGYFGRDSYSDKRIEAVGADWVVARELDGLDNGIPLFCNFKNTTEMLECLGRWSMEQN